MAIPMVGGAMAELVSIYRSAARWPSRQWHRRRWRSGMFCHDHQATAEHLPANH